MLPSIVAVVAVDSASCVGLAILLITNLKLSEMLETGTKPSRKTQGEMQIEILSGRDET